MPATANRWRPKHPFKKKDNFIILISSKHGYSFKKWKSPFRNNPLLFIYFTERERPHSRKIITFFDILWANRVGWDLSVTMDTPDRQPIGQVWRVGVAKKIERGERKKIIFKTRGETAGEGNFLESVWIIASFLIISVFWYILFTTSYYLKKYFFFGEFKKEKTGMY